MTTERGYAKGIAKRQEILTVALELVAERGYTATTIRELAEAVGLSKTGLLHHFGSKEKLFTEILERRDAIASDPQAHQAGDFAQNMAEMIHRNQAVSGLVQLYTRFCSEATDSAHPAHEFFANRYAALRAQLTEAFEQLRSEGGFTAPIDSASCATLLIATLDGLQTQWLYDQSVDMTAQVERFFALVSGGNLGDSLAGPS